MAPRHLLAERLDAPHRCPGRVVVAVGVAPDEQLLVELDELTVVELQLPEARPRHVDDRRRPGREELGAHRARGRGRRVGVSVGAELGLDERAAAVGRVVAADVGQQLVGDRRRQRHVGVVVVVRRAVVGGRGGGRRDGRAARRPARAAGRRRRRRRPGSRRGRRPGRRDRRRRDRVDGPATGAGADSAGAAVLATGRRRVGAIGDRALHTGNRRRGVGRGSRRRGAAVGAAAAAELEPEAAGEHGAGHEVGRRLGVAAVHVDDRAGGQRHGVLDPRPRGGARTASGATAGRSRRPRRRTPSRGRAPSHDRPTNGPTAKPAATVADARACSSPPSGAATNASTSAGSGAAENSRAPARRETSPVPGASRRATSLIAVPPVRHADLAPRPPSRCPCRRPGRRARRASRRPAGAEPARRARRSSSSSSWRYTPSVHSRTRSPERTGTASTSIAEHLVLQADEGRQAVERHAAVTVVAHVQTGCQQLGAHVVVVRQQVEAVRRRRPTWVSR